MQILEAAWKRIKVFLKWVCVVLFFTYPWVFDPSLESMERDPGGWVEYAGFILVGIFAAGMEVYHYAARRTSDTRKLQSTLLYPLWLVLLVGGVMALFGELLHTHVRFALERSALERFVAEGGACPTSQCLQDAAGITAFVWGSHDRAWTGICHDPGERMSSALRAAQEDREARRRPLPRVFDAVATSADPMGEDWYACSARPPRLSAPLSSTQQGERTASP